MLFVFYSFYLSFIFPLLLSFRSNIYLLFNLIPFTNFLPIHLFYNFSFAIGLKIHILNLTQLTLNIIPQISKPQTSKLRYKMLSNQILNNKDILFNTQIFTKYLLQAYSNWESGKKKTKNPSGNIVAIHILSTKPSIKRTDLIQKNV